MRKTSGSCTVGRLKIDMGKEDDSMKPDEKDVDERESYKFEPDPNYPYINKNYKKHPDYKKFKVEIDAVIEWAKRSHGDE